MFDDCDSCGQPIPEGEERVEVRIPRPSDPHDMACIMVGHKSCFPSGKTHDEWQEWIETEGLRQGFIWLS